MTIFRQPDDGGFYTVIRERLAEAKKFDVISAWVRVTGLDLIWLELEKFLEAGGEARFIVGIDHDNTSIEALQALGGLADKYEKFSAFVYHDEASPIFHPKIYSFTSDNENTIFSGSNNLTGAGLSLNKEFMLSISHEKDSDVGKEFEKYIDSYCDPLNGFTSVLSKDFCKTLADDGYATSEKLLRGKTARRPGKPKKKSLLFAKSSPKRLPIRGVVPTGQSAEPNSGNTAFSASDLSPSKAEVSAEWNRVFLKLKLARKTQSQLPKPVFLAIKSRLGHKDDSTSFKFIERSTGQEILVSPAGNGNTYKLEAKVEPTEELLLRLEIIGGTVIGDFLDSASPEGTAILNSLLDGLEFEPPITVKTKPDVDQSTLYRFD